jgi:hypothetical protein
MATDVTSAPPDRKTSNGRADDTSLSSIVSGILDDGQKLIESQMQLLKLDVFKEIERVKDTGILFGIGAVTTAAGGVLLLFMLVHLIERLARPHLELWACFGLVGAAVAIIGGVVLYQGKQKLDKLADFPDEAAQGLKENLQWKTNPK